MQTSESHGFDGNKGERTLIIRPRGVAAAGTAVMLPGPRQLSCVMHSHFKFTVPGCKGYR